MSYVLTIIACIGGFSSPHCIKIGGHQLETKDRCIDYGHKKVQASAASGHRLYWICTPLGDGGKP